jgi:hypothetical protein
MVSSFGLDHNGEILLLNYSVGTVVRLSPDFEVVPRELTLSGASSPGRIVLNWSATIAGPVPVQDYVVERLQEGRIVERVATSSSSITLDATAAECFRVRARARNGAHGPASSQICTPD